MSAALISHLADADFNVVFAGCPKCQSQNRHEHRSAEAQKGKAIDCQHCGYEIFLSSVRDYPAGRRAESDARWLGVAA